MSVDGAPRYSLCCMSNVIFVHDDVACMVVDQFTPEEEDAAHTFVQDLNNGDETPRR